MVDDQTPAPADMPARSSQADERPREEEPEMLAYLTANPADPDQPATIVDTGTDMPNRPMQ